MKTTTAFWTICKSFISTYKNLILGAFFTNKVTSARHLDFTIVRYSQLWEDGRTLRRGLGVQDGEVVLSIAAAGDNAIGLLLDNPSKVVAVDISPAQIALVSLKIHAIKHLPYEEFTQLLGFQLDDVMSSSTSGLLTRGQIYSKLRPFLPDDTREFWDARAAFIDSGVMHCGKIETFFDLFRTCVSAFVHSKETISKLLGIPKVKDQRSFFINVWDTALWRFIHRLVFSRMMLGRARDPSLVDHTTVKDVSEFLLEKHATSLQEVPITDNFFEEYILTGQITGKNGLPDYLKRENYALLRQRVDRIQLLHADLFVYLDEVADCSDLRFDAFNLSDLFEWFPLDVAENLYKSLIRVSNPGARLAYWTFLNCRHRLDSLADRLVPQMDLSRDLYKADRTWFYSDFVVEKVQ
ncbi:uncharacterized protein [Asterias amurensis]|uniref:uncharacterized protein n=1 Tax=Asterias amurensis TaxID=7602 RepID=UPI003AB61F4A